MTPPKNSDWEDLSIEESKIPDDPRTKPKPRSTPLTVPLADNPPKAEAPMPDGGWIRVSRTTQDHWLSKNRPYCYRGAWEWLLLEAAFADHKDKFGRLQRRGMVFTSQFALGKAWGWDRKKVRAFLNRLQNEEMITFTTDSNKNTGGTRITITNYDRFQSQSDIRVQNGDSSCLPPVRNVAENSPSTFHSGNGVATPHHSSPQLLINSPQHNNATTQPRSKQTESVEASQHWCCTCGKVRVLHRHGSCNECWPL